MLTSLRLYLSQFNSLPHQSYLLKMDDRIPFEQSESATHRVYFSTAQIDQQQQERRRIMLLPRLATPSAALNAAPEVIPDTESSQQYLQQGKQLVEQGDLAGAIEVYRRALQLEESAALYEHLAHVLSQQGNLAEAASYYRRAIELSVAEEATPMAEPNPAKKPLPWFEEAAFQLQQGQAHLNLKNWQAAVTACEQAVKIMGPKTSEAYNTLAKALQAQGELEAAKGCLTQALHLQPKTAELHAHLGSVYLQQQQLSEAMNCYQRAVALNPQFAAAYWEMGRLWKQMGDPDQSTDCWYRALQLEPSWGTAREHWSLGTSLVEQNKLEQAVQSYRQAIRIDPKLAEAYHNLGVVLGKQKRWQEALQEHRQAVMLNPENPQFWAGLGRALVMHESWEEAIAVYQKVTKLDLNGVNYGIFQHALGQLEQCQKAMVAQSYCRMAENLAQQQKWQEAVNCYRQAIERYPGSAEQYAGLGKALAKLEQWQEAVTVYQRAMELAPDNTNYYLAFGELLIQREQFQKQFPLQVVNNLHTEFKDHLDQADPDENNAKLNAVEVDNLTLL